MLGVTSILALAGCVDFSFVDEEAKFRGSEVHRVIQLSMIGTLDRKTLPPEYKGYRKAFIKFMRETGFIPQQIEKQVENVDYGIRGRLDATGLMRGIPTIVDFKTGTPGPAVGLQLALYGYMMDPTVWWARYAVMLKSGGTYAVKQFKRDAWHSDLNTALAAARLARWRLANNLVK